MTLPGFMAPFFGGANSGTPTFTFATSGTSNTNTVLIPAAAQAGDLAVVFDGAFNTGSSSITSVTPSGWFTAVDDYSGFSGADGGRMKVNYKKLVAGDLGTSPAFSNDTDRKVILIFRPSTTINTVVNGSWNSELTTGNPVAQTVTVSGVATPLIVFAFGAVNAASGPTFSTETPTMNKVVCTGAGWSVNVGYLIYNTSPSNQSVDIGDGGSNGLQSGYLRFT